MNEYTEHTRVDCGPENIGPARVHPIVLAQRRSVDGGQTMPVDEKALLG